MPESPATVLVRLPAVIADYAFAVGAEHGLAPDDLVRLALLEYVRRLRLTRRLARSS